MYRAATGILRNASKITLTRVRLISTSHLRFGEIVEVLGPAFADSISEGDVRWMKQKGDFVKTDDIVAEIETDKTAVEVPAQYSGTIVELLVEDGSKVVAKQKLYKLEKGDAPSAGAAAAKEEAPPPKREDKPEPPKPPSKDEHKAHHKKQEPITIQQKAVHQKEIPEKMPSIPETPSQPVSSKPTSEVQYKMPQAAKAADGTQSITGDRTETRIKMNRMRQRIAERLKEAQNTNAMLTTFNEVDLTNVMQMRKKYQELFQKKHSVKLGLMSPFVRASAVALQDQPIVNAVIDGSEIVYRNFCDISIAVATPKGLVVPVVRNVESMGLAQIEKTLGELGAKARDGKIAIEDMEGGTFTISNGGVFGSMFGTPIINPPQSAILGMHGIFDRPIAVDGKVEIRPMMYIALTYDHRLIDGREAVYFLRKVKQAVEDPVTILLDL
ncbi:2-oxoacid dehydrogenases acyltransferase (catalytic domain) domain-containing protein [Ditylenchus destructor]|nr:2-oxoacid dehydrogenases acyltransferase (catalytic domain) domain-containing protein [Ditylenchus destructor]